MRTLEEIKANPKLRNIQVGMDGLHADIHIGGWDGSVIFSWGGGWYHASVAPYKRRIMPSYEDMCQLKNIFWTEDEDVIHIYPKKINYVNNIENCLHLWSCKYTSMILPPSCFVGYREGQTRTEFEKEVREAYELAGEKYE